MYDIGSFYEAASVEDAIRKLQEWPDAEIISGGSDVLIKIREGKLAGRSLVSIHNIAVLKGVTMEEDGTIVIGPGTSFSHITAHPLVLQHIPMLGYAVDQVGGPQIRNIGTIGGNVCNGVTSADSASSLFAYNAILELTGPEGIRQVPIQEFYTGPGKTVRRHEEVMTAIRIRRRDYEGYTGCYIKYGKRNAMEIATLGCACLVKLSWDKKVVEDMRIAYGVAAPTPVRMMAMIRKRILPGKDRSLARPERHRQSLRHYRRRSPRRHPRAESPAGLTPQYRIRQHRLPRR